MKPELFVKNTASVYALQFDYSEQGLKALIQFLGSSFVFAKKPICPNSVSTAAFKNNYQSTGESTIQQGDYIIRDDNGFWPVSEARFKTTYIKV